LISMLVFWKQRLVILSTPKTGSTAIESALEQVSALCVTRPPELKHTPAYRYQRFLRPYLQNSAGGDAFAVVALMREPIDWLGSWYRYRRRPELDGSAKSSSDLSFDDFATAYMSDPRPEVADVGGQARFLSGLDGAELGVDQVFRYEALDRFTAFLEDRLDFAIELPRLNVSPQLDLRLTEPTHRKLRSHLAAEYRIYERFA
jgi:hypothetical protein